MELHQVRYFLAVASTLNFTRAAEQCNVTQPALTARIQAFYQHFAKALKCAQQALAAEPGRAVLWLETGRCQLQLGLVTQAQNSFEQARELDPDCPAQESLNQAADTGFLDKLTGRWRQWFQR